MSVCIADFLPFLQLSRPTSGSSRDKALCLQRTRRSWLHYEESSHESPRPRLSVSSALSASATASANALFQQTSRRILSIASSSFPSAPGRRKEPTSDHREILQACTAAMASSSIPSGASTTTPSSIRLARPRRACLTGSGVSWFTKLRLVCH